MPLLRSTLSDPIAAGINSFKAMSDIFNQQESLKIRRELMDRQKLESEIRMQREKSEEQFREEGRGRQRKMWDIEDQLRTEIAKDPDFTKNLESAIAKDSYIQEGKEPKYTEEEGDALLIATSKMPHVHLDVLDKQIEAANTFRKALFQIAPQIMQSPQKQIILKREQVPQLFSSFEEIYPELNTGMDQYGNSVEEHGVKKTVRAALINKAHFTGLPMVSFVLDVESPNAGKGKGPTRYSAPMTHGHGPGLDEEIVQLPIDILDAHSAQYQQHLNRIKSLRAQLDPKAWADKIEKMQKTKAENKAISDAYSKVDTTKGIDEQRKQFITEFTKQNPDASVKETTELAKLIIAQKAATVPKIQNIQIGDKNVPHVWDPEKGAFVPVGEGGPKFKPEKKPEWKPGERALKEKESKTRQEDIVERRLERKGEKAEKKEEKTEKRGEKVQTKYSKEKVAGEKRVVDAFGEKGFDAPKIKTIDGLLPTIDNPKKRAQIKATQRLMNQYIDQGDDNGTAFTKAQREIEDELKRQGISVEEPKK